MTASPAVSTRSGYLNDLVTGATFFGAIDARHSSFLTLSSTPSSPPLASVDLSHCAHVRIDLFGGVECITFVDGAGRTAFVLPTDSTGTLSSQELLDIWLASIECARARDGSSLRAPQRPPRARLQDSRAALPPPVPSTLSCKTELRVCASPTRLIVAGRERGCGEWRVVEFDRTVPIPSNLAAIMRPHAELYSEASVTSLFRENGAGAAHSYKDAATGASADDAGRPRAASTSAGSGVVAPGGNVVDTPDGAHESEVPPPSSLLSFFTGLLTPSFTTAAATPAASASAAPQVASASEYFSFNAVSWIGAIAFTRGYYFVFATKREAVGEICGHTVYSPRGIEFVSVSFVASAGRAGQNFGRWLLTSTDAAATIETRYQSLFLSTDFTKDFFFSPTYDLSRSLQEQAARGAMGGRARDDSPHEDGIFVWNAFLRSELHGVGAWTTPLVHGFFRQVTFSVLAAVRVRLTLLARRSRVFAGARYLKRGANAEGAAANDVETEQIVEDDRGACSAYLQLRGSVPAPWTQRTAIAVPRPPIVLQPRDPTHATARRHAAALFERYGAPLLVLNLVKKREKGAARESTVGREWARAVAALNKELSPSARLQYLAIDYAAVVKTPRHNILAAFRDVGRWAVENTGFFCSVARAAVAPAVAQKTAPSDVFAAPPPLSSCAALFNAEDNEEFAASVATPRSTGSAARSVYASGRRTIPSSHVLASAVVCEGDAIDASSKHSYLSQLNALGSRRVVVFRPPPRVQSTSGGAVTSSATVAAAAAAASTGGGSGNGIRWLSAVIPAPSRNFAVDLSAVAAGGTALSEDPELALDGRGGRGASTPADSSKLRNSSPASLPVDSMTREDDSSLGSLSDTDRTSDDEGTRSRAGSSSSTSSSLIGESAARDINAAVSKAGSASILLSQPTPATTSASATRSTLRYTTLIVGAADSADVIRIDGSGARSSTAGSSGTPADRDDVLAPVVLPRLSEDDSLRPELHRDFMGLTDSAAAAIAAGSSRYVFACSAAQNALPGGSSASSPRLGLGARLMDLGSVGGEGDYCYVDVIPRPPSARKPAAWAGSMQRGVLRTNCIDCLDRTNVSQVQVGAHVLGLQLHALGLSATTSVDPSSPYVRVLMELFEAHGDAIALQYGGSEANKKVTATAHEAGMRAGDAVEAAALGAGGGGGGEAAPWRLSFLGSAGASGTSAKLSSSGPSEILTSLQRYYSNSFTDSVKQDAMNLSLGLFRPRRIAVLDRDEPRVRGEEAADRGAGDASAAAQLWDIESDFFLHRTDLPSHRAPGEEQLWCATGLLQRAGQLAPELPSADGIWAIEPLKNFDALHSGAGHATAAGDADAVSLERGGDVAVCVGATEVPRGVVAAAVAACAIPATTSFDELLSPPHCVPQEAAHVVLSQRTRVGATPPLARPTTAAAAARPPAPARPPARPPPPPPPTPPPAAPLALSAPKVLTRHAPGGGAVAEKRTTRHTLAFDFGDSLFDDIMSQSAASTAGNAALVVDAPAPSDALPPPEIAIVGATLTAPPLQPNTTPPLLDPLDGSVPRAPHTPANTSLADARFYNEACAFPETGGGAGGADPTDADVFERVGAFAEHVCARKLERGLAAAAAVDAVAAADAADLAASSQLSAAQRTRTRDTFIFTDRSQIDLFRSSLLTALGSDAAILSAFSNTARTGPFAGESVRKLAAPIILSSHRRGEWARARAYVEYVGGGGGRGAPALLTSAVSTLGVSVISF